MVDGSFIKSSASCSFSAFFAFQAPFLSLLVTQPKGVRDARQHDGPRGGYRLDHHRESRRRADRAASWRKLEGLAVEPLIV